MPTIIHKKYLTVTALVAIQDSAINDFSEGMVEVGAFTGKL